MMSAAVIHVENLGKRYRICDHREAYSTLRDAIASVAQAPLWILRDRNRKKSSRQFWALKDVSFEVKQGEFSAWNMYYNEFDHGIYRPLREVRDCNEAVRDESNEIHSGKNMPDPVEQLLRYFQFFEHDQILILDSRELKNNTACVIDQVIHLLARVQR